MDDQMLDNSSSSSQSIDLDTLRSRISKLNKLIVDLGDEHEFSDSESRDLVRDCAVEIEEKVKLSQVLINNPDNPDINYLAADELDLYLEQLKGKLITVEAKRDNISNEIEDSKRTYMEDYSRLGSDLEVLEYSVSSTSLNGLEGAQTEVASIDCPRNEDQTIMLCANKINQFKILELNSQMEKNENTLKSLEDLDSDLKRLDAIENIEDALSGLKVVELERNNIKLSLRTEAPYLEDLFSHQKLEDINDQLKQTHELVVELVDGTMELKNAEIFPCDVYINEIVDAARSFRKQFLPLPLLETRSPLEWFVRKVHYRILLSILRRVVVKSANKSRHSIEYVDIDDSIVAHMVGGVDAFMKLSQGWPLHGSPPKLIALKNSSPHSKEISLTFLCKVQEAANSLDREIQQNISTFLDAIEEILMQHMRAELQSFDSTRE